MAEWRVKLRSTLGDDIVLSESDEMLPYCRDWHGDVTSNAVAVLRPRSTEQVAQDFKLFYKKQASGGNGGYTIDHSAGIYVFDKQGALRVFMNHGQKPQDIAHDLKQLM